MIFMIIMGIDPGYAIVGVGVIRYENNRYVPLEYGAVITDASQNFEDRLLKVYDGVRAVIERWKPDAVSVEELFFNTNNKTAIFVSEARGVILLACRQAEIPIFEYTPLQVKMGVVGYGRAVKQQVMEMTRKLLCLKEIPKPDDAADALAVAICHANVAGRQNLLRRL